MTKPEQPPRKPRAIAIIEQLDDGRIRILPNATNEAEIAAINEVLKDRIKLDE